MYPRGLYLFVRFETVSQFLEHCSGGVLCRGTLLFVTGLGNKSKTVSKQEAKTRRRLITEMTEPTWFCKDFSAQLRVQKESAQWLQA